MTFEAIKYISSDPSKKDKKVKPPLSIDFSRRMGTVGAGGEGTLSRRHVYVGDRFRTLVYKHLDVKRLVNGDLVRQTEEEKLHHALLVLEIYGRSKDAKLPVPPTYRLLQRNGKIEGFLITDLSDGRKNFVFTVQNFVELTPDEQKTHRYKNPFKETPLKPRMKKHRQNFLAADLSPTSPYLKQAIAIADKAAQAGILLDMTDGWMFVMNPKGEISIVFPGDPASGNYGTYDTDGIWQREIVGPTSRQLFYPSKEPLDRNSILQLNAQWAIRTFHMLYRYQQKELGIFTSKNYLMEPQMYEDRAKQENGLITLHDIPAGVGFLS